LASIERTHLTRLMKPKTAPSERSSPTWPGNSAAFQSCRHLRAFVANLGEGPTIPVKCGLLAREVLPPGNRHIHMSGVHFDCERDSRFLLAGNDGLTRSAKGIVNRLADVRVVLYRAPHTFDQLLGAMDSFRILLAILNMPKRALLAVSVPMPCTSNGVPRRFVLPMVVSASHHERRLSPNNLAANLESARLQAFRYSAGV